MSLLAKIEMCLERGEGLLEILNLESDFRETRSDLLVGSLNKILHGDLDERPSDENSKKYFSSRRQLKLKPISNDGSNNGVGLAFDINDMVQASTWEEYALGDLIGADSVLFDLKKAFESTKCEVPSCSLGRIDLERDLAQIEFNLYEFIFVGPLYISLTKAEQEIKIIQWAFREGRQRGLRRFYIDGKIKSYPSFSIEQIETEVSELGTPKIFIPLERSLSHPFDLGEINKFYTDYIYENRNTVRRILSSVLIGSESSLPKILPLTGSYYCSKCNLVIRESEQGALEEVQLGGAVQIKKKLNKKLLGILPHQLKDLTIGELVTRVKAENQNYYLPTLWEMLDVGKLSNLKLSDPYSALPFVLRILIQLSLIQSTKVKGVVFLLELMENDFFAHEYLIVKSLGRIQEEGNVILLCISKEKVDKEVEACSNVCETETKQEIFLEPLYEFTLKDYQAGPLVVDLLNLREIIFKVYMASKSARVLGFSSLDDLGKKVFQCSDCKGQGYQKQNFPFGYVALKDCITCVGTGCRSDLLSLTSYGLTLKDCYLGSLQDLVEQFLAEPRFLSSVQIIQFKNTNLNIKINTLINDLSLENRKYFVKLAKNTAYFASHA